MNSSKITSRFSNLSPRKAAIIVGISLLAMAIMAAFSYGVVLIPLIENDAQTSTIGTIKSSISLFRLGIMGWLIILILDVIVAWALYIFFKPANNSLSLLTAWLRIIYTMFLASGILCLVLVLLLASDTNYTDAFNDIYLNALAQFFLNAFITIWTIGLIIFGLHLATLSYLVVKDLNIHNAFSIFLAIAALSYIIISTAKVVAPAYQSQIEAAESILSVPMAISEIAFGIWLLIKGGKVKTDEINA